jgi:hypothetical protein
VQKKSPHARHGIPRSSALSFNFMSEMLPEICSDFIFRQVGRILGWETGIENTLKQQRKNLLAHR